MKKYRLLILLMVPLFMGCSIIFEDDLSKEIIHVNMPVDGTITSDNAQLFWWELVDGALGYSLQIMSGSFADPISLVVDTNAIGDKFYYDLVPGIYQWRIKGWNNYSETDYVYNELEITDLAANEE